VVVLTGKLGSEHRTREGGVSCCVVHDAHSRRVAGWSIDTHQASSLVTNALSMALTNRTPTTGTVIHSDRGTQFTCWSFMERVRKAGLAPSMGTVGDAYDNVVIESFWGRLQTELLNRQKWRTRIELSAARFEYREIFHNRTRRHSSLGMLTPVDYENLQRGSASVA
jgi:transposase InsO family protein